MKKIFLILIVALLTANFGFGGGDDDQISEKERQQILKKILSGEKKTDMPEDRANAALRIRDADFLLPYLENDPDPDVRRAIVNVLHRKGSNSKVVSVLKKVGSSDPDMVVRDFVAGCLIKRGYEKEAFVVLESLIQEKYLTTKFENFKNEKIKKEIKKFLYEKMNDNQVDITLRACALINLANIYEEKIDNNKELIENALKNGNIEFVKSLIKELNRRVLGNDYVLGLIEKSTESANSEISETAKKELDKIKGSAGWIEWKREK